MKATRPDSAQIGHDGMPDHNTVMEMGKTCVCFNLRKATRNVTRFYDKALKSVNLRVTQLSLLAGVRVLGPVMVTRLAKIMALERTTLSRNLKILEKKGFIEISPGTDFRVRSVGITDQGLEVLAGAYPLWRKAQDEFIRGLTSDGVAGLLGVLDKVSAVGRVK
jgi:DNA-binding MarR family transcriptional regulator